MNEQASGIGHQASGGAGFQPADLKPAVQSFEWTPGECILVRNRENNYTFPAVVTREGKTGRPMARWEAQFRTRKGTLTKETCIDGLRYEVAGAASPADVEHLRSLLRQEEEA